MGITYPGSTTNSFAYNGEDLRTQKVDSSGTKNYVCDGSSPASAVLKDGSAVYTPGLSERRGSASKFLHADALGSTRGITDSTQAVTDSLLYDAFGNTLSRTGTTPTPFGFVGASQYQSDSDSSLQLLGHRYYDPSIGRFLSQDPIQDGTNWYAYCDNNPLTQIDPLGLEPPIIGKGFSKKQKEKIQKMIRAIQGTKRGRQITAGGGTPVIIVPLKPTDPIYPYPGTERTVSSPIPYKPLPRKIHFDPDGPSPPTQLLPPIPYLPIPYIGHPTPTQMLAHELGHAETGVGDDGPGNMNNTNKNENPIARELGLPQRRAY